MSEKEAISLLMEVARQNAVNLAELIELVRIELATQRGEQREAGGPAARLSSV